jgi:hypothetical protein
MSLYFQTSHQGLAEVPVIAAETQSVGDSCSGVDDVSAVATECHVPGS